MSYALTAVKRTATGRRAKHVHDDGNIPGVVYGSGAEAGSIQVSRAEFRKVYRAAGMSSLIDLAVEGAAPVKAVIKDVQVNPISLEPYHIDFHQVRMDREMEAEVPLKFVGESLAVKGLAGTLVRPLDALHVHCLPADLPHEIEVDISVLNTFDDSITVADLKLPKGVTVEEEPTALVANVAAPLTEEQLKKMDEEGAAGGDVTAIKTEAEEKKAAEDAKKAEEEAAAAAK